METEHEIETEHEVELEHEIETEHEIELGSFHHSRRGGGGPKQGVATRPGAGALLPPCGLHHHALLCQKLNKYFFTIIKLKVIIMVLYMFIYVRYLRTRLEFHAPFNSNELNFKRME